jgi:hypothetical protein
MTKDKWFKQKDGEQAFPSLALMTDQSGPLETPEASAGIETRMKVLQTSVLGLSSSLVAARQGQRSSCTEVQ